MDVCGSPSSSLPRAADGGPWTSAAWTSRRVTEGFPVPLSQVALVEPGRGSVPRQQLGGRGPAEVVGEKAMLPQQRDVGCVGDSQLRVRARPRAAPMAGQARGPRGGIRQQTADSGRPRAAPAAATWGTARASPWPRARPPRHPDHGAEPFLAPRNACSDAHSVRSVGSVVD